MLLVLRPLPGLPRLAVTLLRPVPGRMAMELPIQPAGRTTTLLNQSPLVMSSQHGTTPRKRLLRPTRPTHKLPPPLNRRQRRPVARRTLPRASLDWWQLQELRYLHFEEPDKWRSKLLGSTRALREVNVHNQKRG